jgi:RimJ/RimL family protein N-acetyltransferase
MSAHAVLETARLILRPYSERDIPALLPLIGSLEVARTTLRIPHPYTEQDARNFVANVEAEEEARLGITLRIDGRLIGGVGLRLNSPHQHAELGYWLGVPYWGRGYATEAAGEMLRYGFESLGLHRIFATCFRHNPVSGRILKKIGMQYEGCQREHLSKWGQLLDSELYGILRREWEAREYNASCHGGPGHNLSQ